MQSHYEIRIHFVADDEKLLDVASAFTAASELLGEHGAASVRYPLAILALVGDCDRYGCPACTTPPC